MTTGTSAGPEVSRGEAEAVLGRQWTHWDPVAWAINTGGEQAYVDPSTTEKKSRHDSDGEAVEETAHSPTQWWWEDWCYGEDQCSASVGSDQGLILRTNGAATTKWSRMTGLQGARLALGDLRIQVLMQRTAAANLHHALRSGVWGAVARSH